MNDVANKKLIKEKEYMILDIVQNLERWEEIPCRAGAREL